MAGMRPGSDQAQWEIMADMSQGSTGVQGRPVLSLVEEGIESALNLSDVGVWEHFLPENRVQFSDGLFQLVGVDPAVGRHITDFWPSRVHPDERARQRASYAAFLGGLVASYEEVHRVWHEQGRWITVLARARWVARGDDTPGRAALGYAVDVTDRTADYDRLRVREERFRMSLSALHGVAYDVDLRTNQSRRDGVRRMLGHDSLDGEHGFEGWLSLIHPEDVERVRQTVAVQRSLGTDYEMIYRVRHQDGRWLHVKQRGTYTLGPDGRPIRAFGVIEDITEAEAHREQLQMQAAIIARMSEGVLLADRAGTILYANPGLEKLFGYGPGELPGRNAGILSFRPEANFAGLLRTVFEGTENAQTAVIDLEGRRRDDSMIPLQGAFSALLLGDRRCVLAVFNDTTERRHLERELMEVATRVQQRIGADLHEGLGQQLAGIAMMLQGVAQRANTDGNAALRGQVDEVVALVNDAIRSTRALARGLSPVRPTREGLIEGFEELVNQVHERYGIRVKLEMSLPGDLQVDETIATNLYRIAQEAVQNAARHAGAAHITVRLQVAGADVELLVTDDGCGFDPVEAARVGMGLRMMRFRAQLVKGYLSVESRPGAGATIRCRCPAKLAREQA